MVQFNVQKWPNMVRLSHFDLDMCFAPQRRALFQHIMNFQECSEPVSFLHFLRAATARTFSTSQRQKVFRTRQFFTLFTSNCASRHDSMQFFISQLARWLRTRRFSEPPEPQNIGKTSPCEFGVQHVGPHFLVLK